MMPIGFGPMIDPITGQPIGYQPAPAPSPEPEQAPVTEQVWKPDFTKAEPWQGVPADYAGVATFVPTNENPLPPWEGDVATAVIPAFNTPDYSALAQKIIDEARVTTQTGTAEEKARAEIIIASGEKSTLVRAGIEQVVTGKEPTRPTAAEVEGIGLGIVAVIALVAFAAGRK